MSVPSPGMPCHAKGVRPPALSIACQTRAAEGWLNRTVVFLIAVVLLFSTGHVISTGVTTFSSHVTIHKQIYIAPFFLHPRPRNAVHARLHLAHDTCTGRDRDRASTDEVAVARRLPGI